MIYAYDKAANIPLVDIYDKLMMLAEIAAAKDMYEKGLEEMKDFREKYGDLMFSDPTAQLWYNNQFNIGGFVSDLYKQGIDPVRSAEGRALVQLYINSRNYGDLNLLRLSDANKKMYEASAAKLGADYDPEFEAWRLGFDPRTHSMVNPDGTLNPFLATSAMPYTNLHDMVHPTFAAIKPHLLNAEQVKGRGYAYDPNYDYEGVTEDDMRKAMEEYMPGVRNNTSYKYQRYLAEQDLIREGNENPTQKEIDARLVENAITSDAGVLTPLTRDKNIVGDNWLDAQKSARDWQYKKLERAGTPGFDSKGNPIPGGGTGTTDGGYNLSDDLYERGLRNMIGVSPEAHSDIPYQQLANNSPEFWNRYYLRVWASDNALKTMSFAANLTPSFLTDHMGRKEISKLNNNDVSGMGMSRLTIDDQSRMVSEENLNALINASVGKPVSSVRDNRTYIQPVKHNDGSYDVQGWVDSKHGWYTDTNREAVMAFIDGQVKVFIPIVVVDDNNNVDRTKYYDAQIQSAKSTGQHSEFWSNGISTIYDPNTGFGRQTRDYNVEKTMGVGSTDFKSTGVNPPY